MSAQLGLQKKVIFFDLHGTLIPRRITPAQALSEAVHPYIYRWDYEDKTALIKKAGKIYSHALKKFRRRSSVMTSDMRKAAIKRAIAILPLPDDEATISSLERDLRVIQQSALFDKQTISILRRLQGRYKLALITNGKKEAVMSKMRRYRLDSFISSKAIFVSSRLGKGKPHPSIFRHALTQMNVAPEHAIVIGDSWDTDIAGAARSGIDAIWINPYDLEAPQRLSNIRITSVRDITELAKIL